MTALAHAAPSPGAETLGFYPDLPAADKIGPRSALIGGSGVVVTGKDRFSIETPFGLAANLCFLDAGKKVLFVNRHFCTHFDQSTGEVRYAPPHEVNYKAIIWCFHLCGVKQIVALSSTGTLQPDDIPVGSVVMPDDFFMPKPDPVTFWPHGEVGAFAADPSKGQVARIHFAPAIKEDEQWVEFRTRVQAMVAGMRSDPSASDVKLAAGQTDESWPLVAGEPKTVIEEKPTVYVNAVGPRFETRAEIRSYCAAGGSVLGMTCAYEWVLASELQLPYALISVVDNSCNGLSKYPGGALQEYMDHKEHAMKVTGLLVDSLANGLAAL